MEQVTQEIRFMLFAELLVILDLAVSMSKRITTEMQRRPVGKLPLRL